MAVTFRRILAGNRRGRRKEGGTKKKAKGRGSDRFDDDEGEGEERDRAGANTDGGLLRRFLQLRRRATERDSREGLVRGAESSIHMDLRRGEDEEMGWEREVGAAAPWAAGDDAGRRRKQRREERDRRREGRRRREFFGSEGGGRYIYK